MSSWQQEQAKKFKKSKQEMYDALQKDFPQVTTITIEYDGAGDDGNMESPTFADQNNYEVEVSEKVSELVSEYACHALEHHKGGWEINDGSFGTITIDVPNQKAHFAHNERYTESREEPFYD